MRILVLHMNKKCRMIISLIALIIVVSFIIIFIMLKITVDVFKIPSEVKYKIEYLKIENAKLWMMKNQQKDYEKKEHEKKIYFFMSDKIINNESEIFQKLSAKFIFPINETYYIYVYKQSKSLPKFWAPDNNKFVFDIIDMHENDLYIILECYNNRFINIINNYKQEEEKNPAITNPHWENADGQTIAKALVGDEVMLCADVADIADGASAKIKIVEKDADGEDDDVATLNAKVQNGKIRCDWKVVYTEDDDDADSEQEKEEKGYTLPEYAFTVECGGATSEESGQLDVMGWIKVQYVDEETGMPLENKKYIIYLLNGTCISGNTDEKGFLKEENLAIGKYFITFKD